MSTEDTTVEDQPVDERITYVTCQWQRDPKPNIIFLIYRWTVFVIFFVVLVLAMADLTEPDASLSYRAKWWIYLSNWAYSLCTLQALFGALLVTAYYLTPHLPSVPNLQKTWLKFCKLYWITNTVAADLAFTVTLMFWITVCHYGQLHNMDAINIIMHLNNSMFVIIDLFVVSHPVSLVHWCYSVVFSVCYILFSVIYYVAGGLSRDGDVYIYKFLDWSKPGTSVGLCMGVMGVILVLHLATWGLYKLRVWIYQKYVDRYKNNNNNVN